MKFSPFPDKCREIAEREFWGFQLQQPAGGLPAQTYSFLELYCEDSECDCRRLWLKVLCGERMTPGATIGFGWESPQFYIDWMFGDASAAGMAGSRLEPMQPQGPQAQALLKLTQAVLLNNPDIVSRIKEHYKAFKRAVKKEEEEGGRRERHRAVID